MKKLPFDRHPELVDEVTEELTSDPAMKRFFIEHDIPNHQIVEHLNDLITYRQERPLCEHCPGLDACKQETYGYQPVLEYRNQHIILSYQACSYLENHQRHLQHQSRISALYMPKMIEKASLADYHMTAEGRRDLYSKIMTIFTKLKVKEAVKGLYLSGGYQIGKTYTLAAMANHFANLEYDVVIAYYPDLVREMKSAIKTGTLESSIERLKHVDVLMLDDIGGEAVSQWVRDEVLGPILQHRLLDQKLTFFSSNVRLKELAKNMTETEQQAEQLKAYRIFERIRAMCEEVVMK
ncbi:MAG: primosomal protein DnaI [Acholeplasmatales bacterium]|nr:MAG: primosomal protein DnaI [Acholeplasmatales bacterium]